MTGFKSSTRSKWFVALASCALLAFTLSAGGAAFAEHHEKREEHEKCEKHHGDARAHFMHIGDAVGGAMHGAHGWMRARTRIGIRLQPMTEDLRAYFKAPKERGVLVAGVLDDSPAAKAGVRAGDVILNAGGENIEKPRDLMRAVRENEDGEKLAITLLRDGRERKLSVTPMRVEGKGKRGGKCMGKKFERLEARLRAAEEKLGIAAPPADAKDAKE